MELEVLDQGAVRVAFFWGLFSCLSDSIPLAALSSYAHSSMHVHLWYLFLFLQEHQASWIRAYPNSLILTSLPL